MEQKLVMLKETNEKWKVNNISKFNTRFKSYT